VKENSLSARSFKFRHVKDAAWRDRKEMFTYPKSAISFSRRGWGSMKSRVTKMELVRQG
jgi:hypothetical protein